MTISISKNKTILIPKQLRRIVERTYLVNQYQCAEINISTIIFIKKLIDKIMNDIFTSKNLILRRASTSHPKTSYLKELKGLDK